MSSVVKKVLMSSFLLASLNLIFSCSAKTSSFEEHWLSMQKEYKTMDELYHMKNYDKFCHSKWIAKRKEIKDIINGKPNEKFLYHDVIHYAMVRLGFGDLQRFEERYLLNFFGNTLTDRFKDVDESWLPYESKTFNCSSSTLSQLYYAAKVFQNVDSEKIHTIVEVGGGYGNLARIFKVLAPNVTYFVIDVPELIALQSIFLRETLDAEDVIVHCSVPKEFKNGVVHLIPIYLLDEIALSVDVFISHFALSETKHEMQNFVINKKFFDADFCFISGQLDGNGNFERQDNIFRGVRKCYGEVLIEPYHLIPRNYELVAKQLVKN